MLKYLLILCFSVTNFLVQGQVEKTVLFRSVPTGARVTNTSGRGEFIGNTPVNHSFSFHSEMSVNKVKLSACGYYDTVIKISSKDDTVKTVMERKRFLILPETDKDALPENEIKQLSSLIKDFLESFSKANIRRPVNFIDFAVLKRNGARTTINIIVEADPDYLILPRIITTDSINKQKWNDLFSGSSELFSRKQYSGLKNYEFYFSVISGKNDLSIRHIPGVEVNDEFRVETSVYEDDYKRVTTTVSYYETVTNPTFNTSLNQSQKYNEIIFRLSPDLGTKGYRLSGTAAINVTNGKMTLLFESEPGVSGFSMLNRFIGSKK